MYSNDTRSWLPETQRLMALLPEKGIFLTGIEGSDPMVDGVRRNQFREAHNFYATYRSRLANIRNLGLRWVRFGPPYSQTHLGVNRYDWELADAVMNTCQELGITVMADLLHFGLPDWLHEGSGQAPYFQNPAFPALFAEYARAFAKRYPFIRFFTLVNEPLVTANFSTRYGLWNEGTSPVYRTEAHYVAAVKHIAQAALLARQAIEQVWREEGRPGEPLFVQNESFELAHAEPGGNQTEALAFNLSRFAALDLIFGHQDPVMKDYLCRHGVSAAEYEWFMVHGRSSATYLGIDHYPTCIRTYKKEGMVLHGPHDVYELAGITIDYWQRYGLPLLHTEVNAWPDHALRLCQATYDCLCQLARDGYPVGGMGWYGDELQIGWQVAMRGPGSNHENPVGLFHKGVRQPVADLFSALVERGLPVTLPVPSQPLPVYEPVNF